MPSAQGSTQGSAQELFTSRAWPALAACVGCHAAQPGIAFLAPGTPDGAYNTVFAFQPKVIDVAAPEASLVLQKGKHTGPALQPEESDALLAWIEAEHDKQVPGPSMMVAFGPMRLALGTVNAVDLGRGAALRFVPSAGGAGLALHQIMLTAGTAALHVVHPLVVSHPPVGPQQIDASDAFGDVDLELSPGSGAALGGGSAAFPAFDPADPITIHFRTLETP